MRWARAAISGSWVTMTMVWPLSVEVLKEFGDDLLVGGVEVAGGFVGQQDGWVVDEGPGDADALLLAAG